MEKLASLRDRFKKLAVLGDIRLILSSSKRTYEQQYEIATHIDKAKAAQIQEIVKQFDTFLTALDESEMKVNDGILHRIKGVAQAGVDKAMKILV
jgi:hypothetical protein